LQPDNADAHGNRGNTLQCLKRYEEAVTSHLQAISLRPDLAEAHNNCGIAQQYLGRYSSALEKFDQAILLNPKLAQTYNNKAQVLINLKRDEEAMQNFALALQLKPDYAEALYNRGHLHNKLKSFQAAIHDYEQAIALKPDYKFTYAAYLGTKMQICDWNGIQQEFKLLANKIQANEKVTHPFNVFAYIDDPAIQKQAARLWTDDKFPSMALLPELNKYPQHQKIRIVYVSADFYNHPVAILTAELFEKHDRSRFEIFAFSLVSPDAKDEITQKMESAFDQFIDVYTLTDQEIAQLARNMQIDIAVDMGGHTGDSRPGIFALRAAPVQVSYLGYAGTMAADYIDYLIADDIIIPPHSQAYYSEKIAYLPHSFFVNDTRRAISTTPFSRAQFGLPVNGFVFCCFNNTYKINPDCFTSWMHILSQVENSVLWLFEGNATAANNLRQAASTAGIAPERLVFAERLTLIDDHLARMQLADLFLDTLPYNAHTTACDALWVGLPVLTCRGNAFAGRVAASLLSAIGLPELITTDRQAYEVQAIHLANNIPELNALRSRLAANRLTTPLFDIDRYTHYLEEAYQQMYQRQQADLAPDHIYIAAHAQGLN
jgi:predicted O-linked N-acetylglucosamine transferase (SPINDLY family)